VGKPKGRGGVGEGVFYCSTEKERTFEGKDLAYPGYPRREEGGGNKTNFPRWRKRTRDVRELRSAEKAPASSTALGGGFLS